MSVKQTANVVGDLTWSSFSGGYPISLVRISTPDRIIYNDRTTIVYWEDGTKTTSRCMDGDPFSKEAGFLACLAKKVYGGHNQYKKYVKSAQVQSNQAPA